MNQTSIPPRTTPCYSTHPDERRELARLFDSTDALDHMDAALLCRDCYFIDQCRQLADSIAASPAAWTGVPSGTWGGELYRQSRRVTRRYRRNQRGEAVPA